MPASDTLFDPVAYINTPRWLKVSLGLDRTRELLAALGNPQDDLRFVHVAGTNGKGSTCAFLAQVLQEAGYRVGLFTSPYLITFEERIRVNGANIPLDDLREVTLEVKQAAEAMAEHPTEFELMTAVAFVHFARQHCDVVVAEVGLGGRLDSTNVITTVDVSVLTSIGLDHVALLGDTVAAIAREKAGIIKPGVPVVSWPQDPEALAVVEEASAEAGCALSFSDLGELSVGGVAEGPDASLMRSFVYRGVAYRTQLLGSYQPSNAALAIEAIGALRAQGWAIADQDVVRGIAATQWPGRFQLVARKPDFIVDGGHNAQGAQALVSSLADVFPGVEPVLLVGILADKDYAGMLATVLPCARAAVAMTPPNPRALKADDLARTMRELREDLPVEVADDVTSAVARARELAGEDGLVVSFGSLYSIGDVMAAL